MPAGDVFGLDGFFLNKSNPITVSTIGINSTGVGAGITVVSGVLNAAAGIATLTLSTAAGLSTTPFYVGAKIAVSGLSVSGVAHTGYNGNFVVTGFAGTTTVSYATTGYVGGVTASISEYMRIRECSHIEISLLAPSETPVTIDIAPTITPICAPTVVDVVMIPVTPKPTVASAAKE